MHTRTRPAPDRNRDFLASPRRGGLRDMSKFKTQDSTALTNHQNKGE